MASLSLDIEPKPEALPPAQAEIERYAEEADLPPKSSYALQLCLEELLTNIVNHGQARAPIALRIEKSGEALQVDILDDGPAFDPTAAAAPDLDADIEERAIGGLGIHLIRTLAERFDYARDGARNRVTLVLKA